jgi:hypothetical protein
MNIKVDLNNKNSTNCDNRNYNTDMSNLIENQDLLLSSALNITNINNDLNYDSYSFINGVVTDGSNFNERQVQQQTFIRQLSKMDIKDEIIDLNIFDMLQSEDPEMTSLLESINNGDIIGYLPQISVNSANKILDNAAGTSSSIERNASSNSISTLIKLDELIENNPENSDSFKDICDLLALNKSDIENVKLATSNQNNNELSLTPPLTPTTLKPSRSSLRIKSRKQQTADEQSNLATTTTNLASIRTTRRQTSLKQKHENKRKISVEEDEENENEDLVKKSRLLNNSNDNSVDSNQAAYLNDNGFSFDNDYSNDDFNLLASSISHDDNSNDRDFKEYVKRTRLEANERDRFMQRTKERRFSDISASNSGVTTDPIKKESNKEAATRYRLKKLNEKDQLFETRIHLEKENDQVKKKIELVQTEINYLKMLLVQMLLSKGVVHSELTKCH